MKFLTAFTLLLSAFYTNPARQVTTNRPYVNSAVGLWIGIYTAKQVPEQGELYYSFIIKPDHTLLAEGKGNDDRTYYSAGKWEIKDSLLIYELEGLENGIQQVGQLRIVDCNTMADGTWRDINNSPNLDGTFPYMRRVPTAVCEEPCFASSR